MTQLSPSQRGYLHPPPRPQDLYFAADNSIFERFTGSLQLHRHLHPPLLNHSISVPLAEGVIQEFHLQQTKGQVVARALKPQASCRSKAIDHRQLPTIKSHPSGLTRHSTPSICGYLQLEHHIFGHTRLALTCSPHLAVLLQLQVCQLVHLKPAFALMNHLPSLFVASHLIQVAHHCEVCDHSGQLLMAIEHL